MPLSIWRITDHKAGHDSQSRGLCKAISKLTDTNIFDISTADCKHSLFNYFFSRFPPGDQLPNPGVIVAAGHQTHLPLMAAKRAFGGKAVVIMKPSLPLLFFDYCLIPEHDGVLAKKNIIITRGAINEMEYNKEKTANTGLILLGGPSGHYRWNEESITGQINKIIELQKNIRWTIADSPRTPAGFLDKIQKAHGDCACMHYADTSSEMLHNLIFDTQTIWVSKDSVSMIYESLTSGATVGLLEPEEKQHSRISRAIDKLIEEKKLISFNMWQQSENYYPFNGKLEEADRCAKLLFERGVFGK